MINPTTISETGMLLVITGPSGTGKDAVAREVLKHPTLVDLKFKRLVTCADRAPRPGEIEGIDYHFVTPKKLDEMSVKGELVEEPKTTGSSRKGTPKNEFKAVLLGEKRLWRIESSLASKIASGKFFDEQFSPNEAIFLKKVTKVVCINCPKEQLEVRRKNRDGKDYKTEEYELRDTQDKPHLEVLRQTAVLVDNLDNQFEQTIKEVVNHILKHHAKTQN
jgi:guanylate kinase